MKMRKILSLALASLLLLAVLAVPAMAVSIPLQTVIDPRDGSTELDGTTGRLVISKEQAIIYAIDVAADGTIQNDWFAPGFEMAITYTSAYTDVKPMSIRLQINEPNDVGYGGQMAVYPDVYRTVTLQENGGDSYTIVFTYDDIVGAYADPDTGRNSYRANYSFEEVLAQTSLISIWTRNIGAEVELSITNIEVTPGNGGGAAPVDDNPVANTGEGNKEVTNPKTGDSTLIVLAVIALIGSCTAVFFLKKKVEA